MTNPTRMTNPASSDRDRVRLVRIKPQRFDRGRQVFGGKLALLRQCAERRQGDVLGIDLEESPQFLAGLAAAETIGAEAPVSGGIRPHPRPLSRMRERGGQTTQGAIESPTALT